MIKTYRELGILDEVLVRVNETKVNAIREMEKMLYAEKNPNFDTKKPDVII
jgi:hypothetical protein